MKMPNARKIKDRKHRTAKSRPRKILGGGGSATEWRQIIAHGATVGLIVK